MQIKNRRKYQNRLQQHQQIAIPAQDIEILTSTRQYREYLFQAIRQAKKRILITALYLENDDAGKAIMHLLYEHKQNYPDVDIRIYVDFHRARRGLIGGASDQQTNLDFYRNLAAEYQQEIPVLGVPVKHRELFGVLHLKGIIVDDLLIYTGASINNVYLHYLDKYRYDRYSIFHNQTLCDSFASYLSRTFDNSNAVIPLNDKTPPIYKQFKKEIRSFKRTLRRNRYLIPDQKVKSNEIGLSPIIGIGRRNNHLNRCIRDLIRSSEKSLAILTPYFNLPDILMRDIRGALLRGVKVDMIIGDKTANDFFISPEAEYQSIGVIPYLYEIYLKRFAQYNERFISNGQLNLHLWKDKKNTFHLKGIRCDDMYHLLTGNNLNARAWGLDLENGLLVHDHQGCLLQSFNRERQTIMANTKRINSYRDISDQQQYPADIRRTLRRVRRTKADALLKRLI